MIKNLSKIQKIGSILCAIIIIGAIAFGIVVKNGYSTMSRDKSNINNATVSYDSQTVDSIDYQNEELSFEILKQELDTHNTVLKVKILKIEYCYNCTKYNIKINEVVKGNETNGNNAVLYQWGGIDKLNDELVFSTMDNSMLLKEDKEYLIFADKRDYDKDYQKKLTCNEYSLGISSYAVSAFVLNESQKNFIDKENTKKYSDLNKIYYTCFSKETLDNINSISKEVIKYYLQ